MRVTGLLLYPALHGSIAAAIPNLVASSLSSLANSQTFNDYVNYLPYGNCVKLSNFLYNYDTTPLIDMWHDRVCSTGCTPSANDYHSKARSLALPIIETEAKNMDLAGFTDAYVTMMDRGYQWAFERCGAGNLPNNGDLCSDRESLAKMAECGRENGWRFLVGNLGTLGQFVSDDTCKKHLDYASDPKHLEETVPAYLEQFKRDMC